MRIKANGDRNEFEEKVARIGQQSGNNSVLIIQHHLHLSEIP